jgi:hypothetical protein
MATINLVRTTRTAHLLKEETTPTVGSVFTRQQYSQQAIQVVTGGANVKVYITLDDAEHGADMDTTLWFLYHEGADDAMLHIDHPVTYIRAETTTAGATPTTVIALGVEASTT